MSVDCPWPFDFTERGGTERPLRPSSHQTTFDRLLIRIERHEAAYTGTEVNLHDPKKPLGRHALRGVVGVGARGRFDPYPNVTRSDQE